MFKEMILLFNALIISWEKCLLCTRIAKRMTWMICCQRSARPRPQTLNRGRQTQDLNDKWPEECIPPGATVGGLTPEAADHCGLREGTLVAQGGADAFIGMLGLGKIFQTQGCDRCLPLS
jgi:ribulose kinase